MEPISALLALAAAHGAGALVQAISGNRDVGALSTDLFKALAESESRIDARLSNIEDLLDELLEQRYQIALSSGVRFLLDAMAEIPPSASRSADLDRARDSFVEAASAAHSSLQQAIAERYLLLCVIGKDRADLVPASLSRVESVAIAAALDAVAQRLRPTPAAKALLRRRGTYPSRFRSRDRAFTLTLAQSEIKSAAQQTINICARLLAETSVLAPTFHMRKRVPPNLNPPEHNSEPWLFTVRKKKPIRIGCITARFLSIPLHTESYRFTLRLGENKAEETLLVSGYLQLRLDPPLPRPFFVEHWFSRYLISPGTTSADVPLQHMDNLVNPAGEAYKKVILGPYDDTSSGLIQLQLTL